MKKSNFLLSILFLLSIISTGYAENLYSDKLDKQLFNEARRALKKESFRVASEKYEKLLSYHPFSQYARDAELEIIYAYYENKSYVYAYSSANNFIEIHPDDKNLDYVYYMKGLINFSRNIGYIEGYLNLNISKHELESFKLSFNDFSIFIKKYPHSIYAQNARQHMIYIKNLLAQHELYIANFYLKRKAYVAALNRFNNLVISYPDTKSAYDALKALPNIYQKINLNNTATITKEIIIDNYS